MALRRFAQLLRPGRPRAPRNPPAFRLPRRSSSTQPSTRASKILSRLPKSFQKYTTGLRNAPVSHVIAFLVLHEITAVVPLVGLFALFHYTPYTPVDYITDRWSGHVRDGVAKFERYFRRKGWFGFDKDGEPSATTALGPAERETVVRRRESSYEDKILKVNVSSEVERQVETERSISETRDLILGWEKGEDGKYRFLADVALAWAITKAILPVRILASVWATPWFARGMIRGRNVFRRA